MKQMKKTIITLMLAMVMLFVTACGGSKASFEKGTVDGNVYTNTSVGVKATVPDGLTMGDEATVKMYQDSALAATPSDKKDELADAIIYDAVIVADSGSSIQIAAENAKKTTGVALKADAYVKNLEESCATQYEAMGCTVTSDGVDTVKLAGKDFAHVTFHASMEGLEFEQEVYAYKVGDYLYYIIVTNMGDDDVIKAFMDSFEEVK